MNLLKPSKLLIVDSTVTIIREGQQMTLHMPVDLSVNWFERKQSNRPMISPRVPVIVSDVQDTSDAYAAGLRKGDVIMQIDSVNTSSMMSLKP